MIYTIERASWDSENKAPCTGAYMEDGQWHISIGDINQFVDEVGDIVIYKQRGEGHLKHIVIYDGYIE